MPTVSIPLTVSPTELYGILVDAPLEVTGPTAEQGPEGDDGPGAGDPPYIPAIGGGPWAETMRVIRTEAATRIGGTIGLPVENPNAPFTQPTDSPWAALSVRTNSTEKLEVGGETNLYRQEGDVVIDIRTLVDDGDAEALRLADLIFDQFAELESEQVRFGLPSTGATVEEGKWLINEVVTAFRSDVLLPDVPRTSGFGDGTVEGFANTLRDRMHQGLGVSGELTSQFDGAPFEAQDDQAWARFSILRGESFRRELGPTGTVGGPGVLVVALFGVLETGDASINDYADAVSEIFRAVSVRGITFRVPNIRPLGVAGRWWQVNVTCPFESQRIFSRATV